VEPDVVEPDVSERSDVVLTVLAIALELGLTGHPELVRERRWGEPAETAAVFSSADAMGGARAFAERRPPVWTGK